MKYLFYFLLCCSSLTANDKPNIIFILLDDMGYSDLGAFGGEVNTPNIDRLANNGLRFTQNYNSARCCPSRASLLTGLYSHQVGIANFTGRDRSAKWARPTSADSTKKLRDFGRGFKNNGYSTYAVGKWHVGHEESPIARGFDEFYGYTRGHSTSQWQSANYQRMPANRTPEIKFSTQDFYATDAFTDYAVEFIKLGQQKDKPFFLYLAHSSPHFPLHAPAASRDKYLEIYRRGWDVLRQERYERQKKLGLITDSWKFTELSQVPVDRKDIANSYPGQQNPPWATLSTERREDLAYRMATFAAMIEHVDQGVGKNYFPTGKKMAISTTP